MSSDFNLLVINVFFLLVLQTGTWNAILLSAKSKGYFLQFIHSQV